MGERLPCKQEVTSSNLVISIRGETNERVGASRMYLENCIQILKRLKVVSCNEARNKFLAYVDFANAKPYFRISLLKSKLFEVFLKTLYADKI